MLTGIAHVNLTVPEGTLDLAEEFYGKTLGMERVAVPALQKNTLAWSDQLIPYGLTNSSYTASISHRISGLTSRPKANRYILPLVRRMRRILAIHASKLNLRKLC